MMERPYANTSESLYRLVRAAQLAPSVLNTQPWSFEVGSDNMIELRLTKVLADGTPRLGASDPRRRELYISCGAALFNLRMAIRVAGYDPVIWLMPDEHNHPDLLASVDVLANRSRSATAIEQRLYETIERRHTSREPYRRRRIRMNMVAELELAAWAEKVEAWLLHRRQTWRLMRMVARANEDLTADAAYRTELGRWTTNAVFGYGVPASAFGPKPEKKYLLARDFGLASAGQHRPVARFERRTRLIALAADIDEPLELLRVGQALQRLLLTATRYGVSASFLTQPFEYEERHPDPTWRAWPWGPKHAVVVVRLGRLRSDSAAGTVGVFGGSHPADGTPRDAELDVTDERMTPPTAIRPPTEPTED